MRVIDPGHVYVLDSLDGECEQTLTFVKREGAKFPGNVGHHPGTTLQEVMRALLDRVRYLQNQVPHHANLLIISNLEASIVALETRAAERHGRGLGGACWDEIVNGTGKCLTCGHVGCTGNCHSHQEPPAT